MQHKIIHSIKLRFRNLYLKPIINKLNKCNFSVVSNTCVGGFMLHDYKQKFNSPFINTYIPIRSYLLLINDFENNLKQKMINNKELSQKNNCPVGTIYDKHGNDINFYFAHSKSFEEALSDWNRRINRINYNKLIFLFDERQDEFDDKIILKINEVKYKHFVFSYRKHENCDNFIKVNDYAWEYCGKLSYKKPFDKIKLHKIVK